MPEPAKGILKPEEVKTNEELYLIAQHLEQYRHATYSPEPYYLEGLKRDKNDIRINNAYGLYLLKKGEIENSVSYFKNAIERQTMLTLNPYSGECYYNINCLVKTKRHTTLILKLLGAVKQKVRHFIILLAFARKKVIIKRLLIL